MRVITWNADGSPDDLARADLLSLLSKADVVCVQSGYERNDLWSSLRGNYEFYQPATRGGGCKNLVMWHSDGRIQGLENFYIHVGDPADFGVPGAGPDILDFRYISCSRFRMAGGPTFVIGSHSIVPQAFIGPGYQLRHTLAEVQIRRTATWVSRQREVVILGGDCALVAEDELFDPLRKVGMTSDQIASRARSTHHGLATDMFWTRGAALHEHRVIDTSGDHFALYAHYALS